MSGIRDLPEIAGLDARRGLVRIPPELDVPLTPRIRRIVDSAPFRRLAHIGQLGLVALVYPGAVHDRFEHSLGVYRLALLFLQRLSHDERFTAVVSPADAELFLVAALLHDLGHWPYCHPLEDLHLAGVPTHEQFAAEFLLASPIAEAIYEDWELDPRRVMALLAEKPTDPPGRVLGSMLSGPIDIDKMDYLARDSLHAGVPYGRNFDQGRLIGSLCLNAAGDGLAISDKGKTAAEMMVFARYVMFSEVYWHHGVRSATAMLQRAFYLLHERLDLEALFRLTSGPWVDVLSAAARGEPAAALLDGLFGRERRLYKRVAQFSPFEQSEIYERLARRPYRWLAFCASRFAALASSEAGVSLAAHEVLFDAPPVTREVEFNVDVYFPKEGRYRRLGEVSPVVRTLAERQFDDYVKRVRIFAEGRAAAALRGLATLPSLVHRAIDETPAA